MPNFVVLQKMCSKQSTGCFPVYQVTFCGIRTIAPEENCPRLGLGFGLVLGLV